MDTVQTAVSKEDALLKDMDENNAVGDALVESKTTACATGDNVDLVPALDNAIVGSGKVAGLHIAAPSDSENADDLLEKIEEVVKDEESNGEIAVDKAIAESSEQDFLKQLEEAEAEAKALRERNKSLKTEEKPPIDLTEESVSSSDEKEKAGNAITKDIIDEPDRAHVADDNAADSTNVELIGTKKSEPIRLDSIDSDVEFVPSESNEKLSDPENADVVEITQSEINAESVKASAKISASDEPVQLDGEVKALENGEIDLTNAEDSENSSEKDEVEITVNETENAAGVVSSSGESNAENATVEKIEESAGSEAQEVGESKGDEEPEKINESERLEQAETREAQSKEVEDVISVESGTSEEEQTIKESAVDANKGSEEVSQTPESGQVESEELKVSDAQRMSVDESPDVVETMEVDEEEKMDVDMVETISDEEMPAEAEAVKPASEGQKHSEDTELVASSEAEAATENEAGPEEEVASEAGTPATKTQDVTSSEAEVEVTKETVSKVEISTESTSNIPNEAEESNPPAAEPAEPELPSTEEVINDPEPDSVEHEEEEEISPTEVENVSEQKGESAEKTEVTITEPVAEKEETETKLESKTDEAQETTSEITLTVDSAKKDIEESKPTLSPATENETSEVTTTEKDITSKSTAALEQNTSISTTEKHEKKDQTEKSVQLSDSTSTVTEDVEEKATKALDKEKEQEDIVKLGCSKPENKLLTNAMKHGGSVTSLEGSPVAASSANVFNSTPILRQFDISSENVSKISEAHGEASRTTEDHNLTTEEATATSSKTEEETGTTSNSDATHQTTDSVTKFLNVIKKQYNGTTSEDSDVSTTTAKVPQDKPLAVMSSDLLSKAFESCPKSSQYEISVWYDEHDIRFLSVEKLEPKKTVNTLDSTSAAESSEKLSSNGSVSSLPQFTLGNRTSAMLSGSSTSSKTPDGKPDVSTIKHSQYTTTGVVDLCKFMIEEFTKIKNKYEPPTTPTSSKISPETQKEEPSTPKAKVTGSSKKAVSKGKSASPPENETETPTKKADKRTLKRALTKSQSDDEEETKPKQTKQGKPQSSTSKTQDTPSKSVAEPSSLYCCLAKWVDKKYYAGRVTEEKTGNKFVVLFEDGASKVLPRESIVFGEGDTLPLKDHSVYALLDDDYELGTVKAIDKSGEKVMYTVDIDGKEIKVSASDIYLTDQQAKTIQNQKDNSSTPSSSNKNANDSPTEKSSPGASRSTRKRPATSPITPEAGFSGGLTKRGGRKPKSS